VTGMLGPCRDSGAASVKEITRAHRWAGGSGLLSESMLDERTKAVLATPRDASHQHARREPVAVDPPVR